MGRLVGAGVGAVEGVGVTGAGDGSAVGIGDGVPGGGSLGDGLAVALDPGDGVAPEPEAVRSSRARTKAASTITMTSSSPMPATQRVLDTSAGLSAGRRERRGPTDHGVADAIIRPRMSSPARAIATDSPGHHA